MFEKVEWEEVKDYLVKAVKKLNEEKIFGE